MHQTSLKDKLRNQEIGYRESARKAAERECMKVDKLHLDTYKVYANDMDKMIQDLHIMKVESNNINESDECVRMLYHLQRAYGIVEKIINLNLEK